MPQWPCIHTRKECQSNDEREVFNWSLTTTNANLVDQIGRQQTHIEGLWEEVGFKNEKINDLHNTIALQQEV